MMNTKNEAVALSDVALEAVNGGGKTDAIPVAGAAQGSPEGIAVGKVAAKDDIYSIAAYTYHR